MVQSVGRPEDELSRTHRATKMLVLALVGFTILLMLLAWAGVVTATPRRDPFIEGALRILIALFVLGAIALRRTRFSAIRLQDIAALRGTSGLLATLRKTTLLVALLGGAVAVMGFVISLMTGAPSDMLMIGVVALAVLFYAYPRRAAWERVVEAAQSQRVTDTSAAKGTIA